MGLAVRGVSEPELRHRLVAVMRADRQAVLSAGGIRWSVRPSEAGYAIDIDATAARALAARRDGPLAGALSTIRGIFGARSISPVTTVDRTRFERAAGSLNRRVERVAFPGALLVDLDTRAVRTETPRPGRTITWAALRAALLKALSGDDNHQDPLSRNADCVHPTGQRDPGGGRGVYPPAAEGSGQWSRPDRCPRRCGPDSRPRAVKSGSSGRPWYRPSGAHAAGGESGTRARPSTTGRSDRCAAQTRVPRRTTRSELAATTRPRQRHPRPSRSARRPRRAGWAHHRRSRIGPSHGVAASSPRSAQGLDAKCPSRAVADRHVHYPLRVGTAARGEHPPHCSSGRRLDRRGGGALLPQRGSGASYSIQGVR